MKLRNLINTPDIYLNNYGNLNKECKQCILYLDFDTNKNNCDELKNTILTVYGINFQLAVYRVPF